MNARLTISNKLLIGFGSVLLVVIANGLVTYSTSNANRKLNEDILNIYNPSLTGLNECNAMVNNSQMLIKNWVWIDQTPNTPDKRKLQAMHEVQFPKLQAELMEISKNWEPEEREALISILSSISDTLFSYHKEIMNSLKSLLDYNDQFIKMDAEMKVEEGGEVIEATYKILERIEALTEVISKKTEDANKEMAASFAWFQNFVVYSVFIIVIIVLIVSIITARSMVITILNMRLLARRIRLVMHFLKCVRICAVLMRPTRNASVRTRSATGQPKAWPILATFCVTIQRIWMCCRAMLCVI